MSTQSDIINGHGDCLKSLVLVELAKPKICCVCINTTIITYQASAKFGEYFTHLTLNSVVWHLISAVPSH